MAGEVTSSNYQGQLKKLQIYAYDEVGMEDSKLSNIAGVDNPYTVFINPESYTKDISYEFEESQGQGTTGSEGKFKSKKPEEMTLEFLFDNTGIIDGKPKKEGIGKDIENFRELLMGFNGESHQPRFFKFVWGSDLIKCRCKGLNIVFKLFNPDGSPIRAVCKVSLKETVEENLRVRMANTRSPDLTHYRKINKGDTLPWMCFKIYGDSKYYIQVARVNKLANFRELQTGSEIFFPPISKESNG